jgi:hypothetical protein
MCRIIFAICVMMIGGAVCGARQKVPTVAPPLPASPVFEPVSSPEMDAFAKKLAEKIAEEKVTLVVVVGGAGPENKVSALGASLRDGLNDALARQATGFRVISTADVGEMLKRSRVSTGMIYCNLVSEWIAAQTQAELAVVLELERLEDGHALVNVELRDQRKKIQADKHANVAAVPFAKIEGEIPLTDSQISLRMIQYEAPLSVPVTNVPMDVHTMAICVYCPLPDRAKLHLSPKFHETIYTAVTVLPDGSTTDIWIVRPVGSGIDPIAISALLTWRFKPAVDRNKHPVATRVPIELEIGQN